MGSRLRNVVTLVAIGTSCWIAAGVTAVAIGADTKIIWTCVSGTALGLFGIRYTVRRSRRSGI
jgi:hypothetical protein